MQSQQMVCHRDFARLEWKSHTEGAGYLGFCCPDPLGSLGITLQTCAVAPTTVSDPAVATSWATAELVQPWVSWMRRQAGADDSAPSWQDKDYWAQSSLCTSLGCVKRLSYVVRIDWWHGEDSPCLLLVNRSLRTAGGGSCVFPTPPVQGWVGVSSGEVWAMVELIMEMGAGQYRSKSPKHVFRRNLSTKRLYIGEGGWNNMEPVVWTNLMRRRTAYK